MSSFKERKFLLPIHEDVELGNGDLHHYYKLEKLNRELFLRFGCWTLSPGIYGGEYPDPDSGEPVHDKSRQYIIALEEEKIPELREYLKTVAVAFRQKVIYFFNGKEVEFIENPER